MMQAPLIYNAQKYRCRTMKHAMEWRQVVAYKSIPLEHMGRVLSIPWNGGDA